MTDSFLPHPMNLETVPYSTISKTYEEARKERLLETLAEYLDDNDVSLDTLLFDMKTIIIELKKHHENQLDKMIAFEGYLP